VRGCDNGAGAEGNVGAGAGATIGKMFGRSFDEVWPGTASVKIPGTEMWWAHWLP